MIIIINIYYYLDDNIIIISIGGMEMLDRDIASILFNNRVLEQSARDGIPIQEALFLIGVTFSNMEEFMMSRYHRKIKDNPTPELMNQVRSSIDSVYMNAIMAFDELNIDDKYITKSSHITNSKVQKKLSEYFDKNLFPVIQSKKVTQGLTPKSNELNIFVQTTNNKSGDTVYHNITVPSMISRFVKVDEISSFVLIEDIIIDNLKKIYNGYDVEAAIPYSLLRSFNMDMVDSDNIEVAISKSLKSLNTAWVTMIQCPMDNKKLVKSLKNLIGTSDDTVMMDVDYVNLNCLKDYPGDFLSDDNITRDLKHYNPFSKSSNIFEIISSGDQLVYHPFDSFDDTVLRFIKESSVDPDVISIKMTMYRVAKRSKIVSYLLDAAEAGKSVTVMVELKARFNERDNLNFANLMREAGIDIIYSDFLTKTHAKLCIVSRKENDKIKLYTHVGTGNYSETNSRVYTDYSYFTKSNLVGKEATSFFNIITGSSESFESKSILFAPTNLRNKLYKFIDSEKNKAIDGKKAKITIKCNAITDNKLAEKLVQAAEAGVKVTLIVRGACIIDPSKIKKSKNLKIYSIVGRFLEHGRIYRFGTGKNEKTFIGSADLMERNLSRRNELLVEISEKDLVSQIDEHISMYLKDTDNKFVNIGNYKYTKIDKSNKSFDSHEQLIKVSKKKSL